MTIDDIYEAVKNRGHVSSMRRFSREFLGRGSNYASDTGLGQCSVGALANLYRRLGEIGQADLQARAFECLLNAEAQP
jgi:hypothetical protein